MSVTLNSPISWKNPSADDSTMLDNLQPNIIKAHVREFLTLIFLRFDDKEAAKSFLGNFHDADEIGKATFTGN
ncbi:hypothetical protein [Rhizobium leguminosarum]|uniref:hypothetical protein n=1 Tax=Rhizobium leguminosarum TaxID=384 RepID=UPI002F94273D